MSVMLPAMLRAGRGTIIGPQTRQGLPSRRLSGIKTTRLAEVALLEAGEPGSTTQATQHSQSRSALRTAQRFGGTPPVGGTPGFARGKLELPGVAFTGVASLGTGWEGYHALSVWITTAVTSTCLAM